MLLQCHEEFWVALAVWARDVRGLISENRDIRHCRIGRITLKEAK